MEHMTEEEFKEYFDSIKDTDKFAEIDGFIKFSHYSSPETLFGKLSKYLGYFHSIPSDNQKVYTRSFVPNYDYFKTFFENYKNGESKKQYDQDGYLELKDSLFLEQPPLFVGATGCFTEGYLLFSNGEVAISKYPLNYKSTKSGVGDPACRFCAIIATGIAKELGVSTSNNTFAKRKDGQIRILSESFLKDNEEMITFMEDEKIFKNSEVLSALEQELKLRNFDSEQIDAAKFEYLKQEFLAKLIALKDQKASNTGILISADESGRKVRLAPMFDYDYSFFIGEKTSLGSSKCDNGETDIVSLIEQYKDYPGFLDFVKQAVKLDMNSVYRRIYKDNGLKEFEHPEENIRLRKFTDFVNDNLIKAKQALRELEPNERGEI